MASEHKRSGWRTAAIVIFTMLLLYVLSIGPAAHVATFGAYSVNGIPGWTSDAVNTFYHPVVLATEAAGMNSVLEWYVDAWETALDRVFE